MPLETEEEIGTIQQRLNALENVSVVVPSPPSHSSSIEGVRYELPEMNDRLQAFEEATIQRIENVEDLVTILKDNVQVIDGKIDDNVVCLSRSIDQLLQTPYRRGQASHGRRQAPYGRRQAS